MVRKSLVIIASALILAVGAAGTQRLRYDSTVFANADQVSAAAGRRVVQAEYPPCVRGVREDRCIQLYERGVRRSYARWLAARGVRTAAAIPVRATRTYRPCRSRTDDNCQQVARSRTAARSARRASFARSVVRRGTGRGAVARNTRWSRAAAQHQVRRGPQRQVVRRIRTTAAPSRTATRAPARTPTRVVPAAPRPTPRPAPSGNTPGI